VLDEGEVTLVWADDGLVALEQLGHLPERQPGGIAVEADLEAHLSVLGLVEEELDDPREMRPDRKSYSDLYRARRGTRTPTVLPTSTSS
jgi:hypothetical protein